MNRDFFTVANNMTKGGHIFTPGLIRGIVILLVSVLFSLFCIHGMEYAICKCIFPDEIMDMPFSMDLTSRELERQSESQYRDGEKSLCPESVIDIYLMDILKKGRALCVEHFTPESCREVFLLLEHIIS